MKYVLSFMLAIFAQSVFSQVNFPTDYMGIWSGRLLLYPSGTELSMSLQISPTKLDSVYKYIITYHGEEVDIREYELHVINKQQGIYRVDEKNGIVLEERLTGNKLTSIFTVSGSGLVVSLELAPDEIIFEVLSWPTEKSTRSESIENGETYKVSSFIANTYQKAMLRR